MSWHATAFQGVIIGGAITTAAQLVTTKISHRGQRDLASEQRLWEKRADVYLDLIREIHQYDIYWADVLWTDEKLVAVAEHLEKIIATEPQMRAFGTSEAGERYRRYGLALANVTEGAQNTSHTVFMPHKSTEPWADLDVDQDSLFETRRTQDDAKKHAQAAINQMRADLGDGQ